MMRIRVRVTGLTGWYYVVEASHPAPITLQRIIGLDDDLKTQGMFARSTDMSLSNHIQRISHGFPAQQR